MTPTKPEDALVAELLGLKAFLEAHHCNGDAITTLLEARKVDAARIDALYAELRKLRGKPTLGVVALNNTALTGDGEG